MKIKSNFKYKKTILVVKIKASSVLNIKITNTCMFCLLSIRGLRKVIYEVKNLKHK